MFYNTFKSKENNRSIIVAPVPLLTVAIWPYLRIENSDF